MLAALAALGAGGLRAEPWSDELARRVVADVMPEVEALRGLEFLRPVPVEVVDAEGVRRYVQERLSLFQQDEQLDVVERAYKTLGLMESTADLRALLEAALDEQVGGFYDPARGGYYLVASAPPEAAPIFTAHELTHALEDQHFDLDERLREVIDDTDALFARGAVHEGSATLLMTAWAARAILDGRLDSGALRALAAGAAGQQQRLAALPPVLLRQLLGPYVLGAVFLTQGDATAPPGAYPTPAVNRAYRDPPRSSEQILHPERYWDAGARDDPTVVDPGGAGRALGRGWRRIGQGVLGELSIALLVGADTASPGSVPGLAGGEGWTNAAATGWDGDRWELWTRRRSAAVLLTTVWDSERDAEEFARALPSRLRARRAERIVVVVAGDVGRKADKLLARMLREAS